MKEQIAQLKAILSTLGQVKQVVSLDRSLALLLAEIVIELTDKLEKLEVKPKVKPNAV